MHIEKWNIDEIKVTRIKKLRYKWALKCYTKLNKWWGSLKGIFISFDKDLVMDGLHQLYSDYKRK